MIVVISILAEIVIPNIADMRERATISALDADARNIETAVDMYVHKNNEKYPTKDETEVIPNITTAVVFDREQNKEVLAEEVLVETLVKEGFLRKAPKNKKATFYLVQGGDVIWTLDGISIGNNQSNGNPNGGSNGNENTPEGTTPEGTTPEGTTPETNTDTDGDGISDEDEIAAGTDPKNPDTLAPIATPYAWVTGYNSSSQVEYYALGFDIKDNTLLNEYKGPKDSEYRKFNNPSSTLGTDRVASFNFSLAELAASKNKEMTFGFKDIAGNKTEFTLFMDGTYIYYWENNTNKAYVFSFDYTSDILTRTNLVLPSEIKGRIIYGFTGNGANNNPNLTEVTIPASYDQLNNMILYTPALTTINYNGNGLKMLREYNPLLSSDKGVVIKGSNEEAISTFVSDLKNKNGKNNYSYLVQ